MPAIDLVPAALNRDHLLFVPASTEMWRRWLAATEHAEPPPTVVEDARQILGTLTLINELRVFQEAGIEPSGLYGDLHAPARVNAVLRRAAEHLDGLAGPVFTRDRGTDAPSDDAVRQLVRWTQLAVFGDEATLLAVQTQAVRSTGAGLLRDLYAVCSNALGELRGPWSLPTFLANSVGKTYYRSRLPTASGASARPVLPTWARCAHPDENTVRTVLEVVIDDETQRVAAEFSVEDVAGWAHDQTVEQLATVHAEVQRAQRFLTAALAARKASGQVPRILVDGRPVPPHLVRWVLNLHCGTAGHDQPRPTSTINAAGLRIRFVVDGDDATMAFVEAVDTVLRLAPDQVPGLLDFLESQNMVTTIAKLRVTENHYAGILKMGAGHNG